MWLNFGYSIAYLLYGGTCTDMQNILMDEHDHLSYR